MTGYELHFITIEHRQRIAVVTFQRPEVMNAWNCVMRKEIIAACIALDADPAVGAVVFTGAGTRAFGAGQDLREPSPATPEEADLWVDGWHALFSALRCMSKPTVAALNGVAAGSSFQFALMVDARVGHSNTRMGQPEINAGTASSMGPWVIHSVLGHILAYDLTLSGRIMDGEECRRHGLFNRVVAPEQVVDEAVNLAAELAAKPALAMALTKQRLALLTETGFQTSFEIWKANLRATLAHAKA